MLAAPCLAGCFVGDAADGLPCEQDADCGIGVACSVDDASGLRCCGGSCLVAGTTATTESSTTVQTTSSTSLSTSSSSTTVASSESTSTGEMLCGNGTVDDGEDCDDENPNCGEDCRFISACGDGFTDVEAGEVCDPWMLPAGQACEAECTRWVAFSWDSDADASSTTRDFPSEFPCPAKLPECIDWRTDDTGPRFSGPYFPPDDTAPVVGDWPQATLLTRAISLPQLDGDTTVTIDVRHAYAINSEGTPTYVDNGVIALVPDGTEDNAEGWIRVLPEQGSAAAVPISCEDADSDCYPAGDEPFCDSVVGDRAFGGERTPSLDTRQLVGPDIPSGTYRLAFRLRYDCGNAISGVPATDDAWQVTMARITVERQR